MMARREEGEVLDGCRLVGGDAPRLQNELTKTRTKISDLAITPPGHFLVQNCVFFVSFDRSSFRQSVSRPP